MTHWLEESLNGPALVRFSNSVMERKVKYTKNGIWAYLLLDTGLMGVVYYY